MPNIDHTQDTGIFQMVQNRLEFVQSSESTLYSTYIWELMNELNLILRKTPAAIGNEINYSVNELSSLADMVCIYALTRKAAITSGSYAAQVAGNTFNKYIKKAEADGVLVEYEIVKGAGAQNAMISSGYDGLMKMFRDDATRKAWG